MRGVVYYVGYVGEVGETPYVQNKLCLLNRRMVLSCKLDYALVVLKEVNMMELILTCEM